MSATVRPVLGTPALLLDPGTERGHRWLVVADLHLGLGASRAQPTGPPGGSAEELAGSLVRTARSEGARGLVIAGDAKHPIAGTPPALRPVIFDFFAEILSAGLRVELVPGNHDGGIERHLPREVTVRRASGSVRAGVGVFHGHRWPSDRVLRSRCLAVGHLHPGFRFAPTADSPDRKLRCWLRVRFAGGPPARREEDARIDRPPREIIFLPAYNPVAGTEALNRARPPRGRSFLFDRFVARGEARAYLLDGTDLGRLPTPAAPASVRSG